MENIDFLELSDVMQIHINQIANYGGANDIRDANLLESAIEQPRASYDGSYLHTFPLLPQPLPAQKNVVSLAYCARPFFDAANGFRGCIAGLYEILRRQGLLEGNWCLDEHESLSPGRLEEMDREYRTYPHLNDDDFVESRREEWLR